MRPESFLEPPRDTTHLEFPREIGPGAASLAHLKTTLSTKRLCHENVGLLTKLLQENKTISVAQKRDEKWYHLYYLSRHCKRHLRETCKGDRNAYLKT